MALKQVRACLGDTWVTLTYNKITGRYEGAAARTLFSGYQPGGHFPMTAEATNENGETTTADLEVAPSLEAWISWEIV